MQHLTLAGECQLGGQAVLRSPACNDTSTNLGLSEPFYQYECWQWPRSCDLQRRGSMHHPADLVKDLPAGGMILAMPAAAPVALMRLM